MSRARLAIPMAQKNVPRINGANTALWWYNEAAAWIDEVMRMYGTAISVKKACDILVSALFVDDRPWEKAYDDETPDDGVKAPADLYGVGGETYYGNGDEPSENKEDLEWEWSSDNVCRGVIGLGG